MLCNGSNKERLFELIEETWIEHRAVLENRDVYFARGDSCMEIRHDSSFTIEKLILKMHT